MSSLLTEEVQEVTELQPKPQTEEQRVRALFDKVKQVITVEPTAYDQQEFCGSVCCIAGWVDAIENGLDVHLTHNDMEVEAAAMQAIGLEPRRPYDDEAQYTDLLWLFAGTGNWPKPIRQPRFYKLSPAARAEAACDAIDYYLQERFGNASYKEREINEQSERA